MNRIARAATLALGVVCVRLVSTAAVAQLPTQPTTNLRSNNVAVDYLEPRDPALQETYDRLKNRRVLEQFAEFLAPLRLPVDISAEDQAVRHGQRLLRERQLLVVHDVLRVCQRPAKVRAQGDHQRWPHARGVHRRQFVSVVLHETGHALSDILRLPVLGREEDSADQISGYFMLQFGKELARSTIKGTYYKWMQGTRFDSSFYWDVHSTHQQRALNYLCLGYGKEPAVFKDFVDKGILPAGARQELRPRIPAGRGRLRAHGQAVHRSGTDAAQSGPAMASRKTS